MRKLVYLHELDSVRTSRKEIIIGQKALFEEIVHNGNQIAMTFNQLEDSQAFLVALKYEKSYNAIMELFRNGSIRLIRYYRSEEKEEVRTAAQYLINALKPTDEKGKGGKFICSALPMVNNNENLKKHVREAVCYSDPSKIEKLINIKKEYEEKKSDIRLANYGIEKTSLEELEYILNYVKMILLISQEKVSYPDDELYMNTKTKIITKKSFMDFMTSIWNINQSPFLDKEWETEYQEAIKLLKEIYKLLSNEERNKRSVWLVKWNEKKTSASDEEKVVYWFAEIIINLCYNYTVEDGINNVSKHYCDEGNVEYSFENDFKKRFQKYWDECDRGIHNMYSMNSPKDTVEEKELPDWEVAARVAKISRKEKHLSYSGKRYEDAYKQEKRKWRRCRIWTFMEHIGKYLWYIILFLIASLGTDGLEILLSKFLFGSIQFMYFIEIAITAIFFSVINFLSSKFFPKLVIPDVTDTFIILINGIRGMFGVLCSKNKGYAYIDRENIS